MKHPTDNVPTWVKTMTDTIANGRKIEARIDNDCVSFDDVTDVPPEDDERWKDDDFNPYVPMFEELDLMPFDVMVGLFAALGVKADAV